MLGAMAFELLATEVIISVALFLFLLAGTITTGEAFGRVFQRRYAHRGLLVHRRLRMEATGVFAIITRLMVGDRRGKLRRR